MSLCGSVCSVLPCLCPQCLRLLAKPVKYRKNPLLLLQVGDQYCGYTVLHVALCILVSCITWCILVSCVILSCYNQLCDISCVMLLVNCVVLGTNCYIISYIIG